MKPEWRRRYDEANPRVTVRVTASLRKTLDDMRKEEGLSYVDLIKRGLMAATDEDAPHQRGGVETEAAYAIKVPCAVCGKPLVMKPNKATIESLKAKGWSHKACREIGSRPGAVATPKATR